MFRQVNVVLTKPGIRIGLGEDFKVLLLSIADRVLGTESISSGGTAALDIPVPSHLIMLVELYFSFADSGGYRFFWLLLIKLRSKSNLDYRNS